MNYLALTTFMQQGTVSNDGQKDFSKQKNSTHGILAMIEIALAADFARFENTANARALISQLQNHVQLPTIALTRSASQPELRTPKISSSRSERRHTQKSQHIKATSVPKGGVPKSQSTGRPTPPPPSKPVKEVKAPAPPSANCSKHKKKIHKVLEPKKEPARRALQPTLLETADLPRMRLGEREKKKIRRLLLMRHVKEWVRPTEQRREGRELRHQH